MKSPISGGTRIQFSGASLTRRIIRSVKLAFAFVTLRARGGRAATAPGPGFALGIGFMVGLGLAASLGGCGEQPPPPNARDTLNKNEKEISSALDSVAVEHDERDTPGAASKPDATPKPVAADQPAAGGRPATEGRPALNPAADPALPPATPR